MTNDVGEERGQLVGTWAGREQVQQGARVA